MNSFLLALTALLILVLSALFAAPLFIDWNDYRPAFETQATKLLGRQVKVGGNVHLLLLPVPELRFDDVKVADEKGNLDKPLLEARSFEAWLNFGTLLSGTFEARKIAIVDPVLRLDVRGDGTGNWSDVGRRGVALPFAPKEVLIDSVSVSGGRIEITKDGAPRLTLEDIAGEASAASLSGPYKVSATYSFAGRTQDLRFSTSEPDAAGLFRVKSALRDPERNTTYLLDGDVTGVAAKPSYDGTIVVRVTNAAQGAEPDAEAAPADEEQTTQEAARPADAASFLELKGPLKATPDHAELRDFDLTIHAKGRPQIMKGRLDLDFAEHLKADAALEARFVDLDALFGSAGGDGGERPSPAEVLYLFAEEVLGEAADFGDAKLALAVEQAGLGGDLIGDLDVALATTDGGVKIDRLNATLPGKNRIHVAGKLAHGKFGPIFAGPVKLDGSDLRALSRWGSGDREVSSQASMGNFTLQANATVGDGELTLADGVGELSDTKFHGALSFKGGERSQIELSLDSDKLDLRELLGEGPIWQSWLPAPAAAAAAKNGTAPASEPSLLAQLHDDDVRVTLRVGELLLPNIPAGKLNAGFTLIRDTLDVQQLDFAAADVIALNGKGRVESLSQAPSGGVDFALKATTTDGLRIVSELFGLPEGVSQSKHLSALAPLDIHVSLVAAKEGDGTKASIDLDGKAGGSDVSLIGRAVGDPAKPTEATIELDGSVTGERPQALLVLLFPELPAERLAAASGGAGKLTLKLQGVPKTKLAGNASLETAMMKLGFDGQGSTDEFGSDLHRQGIAHQPGCEPRADAARLRGAAVRRRRPARAPRRHRQAAREHRSQRNRRRHRRIAGRRQRSFRYRRSPGCASASRPAPITSRCPRCSARWSRGSARRRPRRCWARSAPTPRPCGPRAASRSACWRRPTATSSSPPRRSRSARRSRSKAQRSLAKVDKKGLAVTSLDGRLFGGTLAASGGLWPRGAGAELEAKAELKGAQAR